MVTTRARACFSIVLVAFLCLMSAQAQRRPEDNNARHNFFQMQRRYNEKFKAADRPRRKPPNEKERDDEEVKFRRFEEFWKLRVDKKGDFLPYFENLLFASHALDCGNCGEACYKTKWNFLGPNSMPQQNMGAIQSLWVNPKDPQEILAGTYSAGLYRTLDGGNQWLKLTNFGCQPGCSDFPISGGVKSIAVNPVNPDIIYIAVGVYRGMGFEYSYGVYKSTNRGENWCPTDLIFAPNEFATLNRIVMEPNAPDTLFAIAGSKVYKTTDGGASWKSNVIYTAPNNHEIQDIVIHRQTTHPGLYFSESGDRCYSNTCVGWNCPLTNGTIWYDPSFNGSSRTDITHTALGITSNPNSEVQLEKALFSATPNSLSILALGDQHNCPYGLVADRRIARIFNGDPTVSSPWVRFSNPPGAAGSHGAGFASAFEVSPVNKYLVFIGSDSGGMVWEELFVSKHSGSQFTLNKDCLHPDLRALAFSSVDSAGKETWIIGNDGGVGKVSGISTTLPNSTNIICKNINNTGLTVTDVLGISNSETDPSRIYGGTQDNGVFDNTTGAWRSLDWFDGYDVVTDVTNANIAYIASNGGLLWRTTNGGTGGSWGTINFPSEAGAWIPPLLVDRTNTLFVGKKNVWRTYNASTAAVWQQVSSFSGPVIRALHIPPLKPSVIIAAQSDAIGGDPWIEKLYRTDTAHFNAAAPAWNGITYNLPIYWQQITGITSDEKGENVWVSMGNFGGHVFLLQKGTTTWKDISHGLPNLPVNVIRYWEGSDDDSLFIGTDAGVYYRNKNMSQWQKMSCGLPNLLISDLEINYRSEKLRASTRGGGIWETSLASIRDQGCSTDSYLAISYTSGAGPQNKELKNNAIVADAVPHQPISITPRNVCCLEPCQIVPSYTWKVYRVNYPFGPSMEVGAGQNSPVSFAPDFDDSVPPIGMRRYNYRVEVTGKCNEKPCPTITIQINRW